MLRRIRQWRRRQLEMEHARAEAAYYRELHDVIEWVDVIRHEHEVSA